MKPVKLGKSDHSDKIRPKYTRRKSGARLNSGDNAHFGGGTRTSATPHRLDALLLTVAALESLRSSSSQSSPPGLVSQSVSRRHSRQEIIIVAIWWIIERCEHDGDVTTLDRPAVASQYLQVLLCSASLWLGQECDERSGKNLGGTNFCVLPCCTSPHQPHHERRAREFLAQDAELELRRPLHKIGRVLMFV